MKSKSKNNPTTNDFTIKVAEKVVRDIYTYHGKQAVYACIDMMLSSTTADIKNWADDIMQDIDNTRSE